MTLYRAKDRKQNIWNRVCGDRKTKQQFCCGPKYSCIFCALFASTRLHTRTFHSLCGLGVKLTLLWFCMHVCSSMHVLTLQWCVAVLLEVSRSPPVVSGCGAAGYFPSADCKSVNFSLPLLALGQPSAERSPAWTGRKEWKINQTNWLV